MPTFVVLTKVCRVDKTQAIWLNLDSVLSLRRVPAFSGSDFYPALPERTVVDLAIANQHGITTSLDVAEEPAEIVRLGREEAGWCR